MGLVLVALFTVLLTMALELGHLLNDAALPFFAILLVLGWTAQLVGHRFFEGRKPAQMDDAWQIFAAPMLAAAEWAFALGLRRSLRDAVERGPGSSAMG